jgi:GAF domain-containing protein
MLLAADCSVAQLVAQEMQQQQQEELVTSSLRLRLAQLPNSVQLESKPWLWLSHTLTLAVLHCLGCSEQQ